jgi:hypothetical protein
VAKGLFVLPEEEEHNQYKERYTERKPHKSLVIDSDHAFSNIECEPKEDASNDASDGLPKTVQIQAVLKTISF